jgi:hypothetical protein
MLMIEFGADFPIDALHQGGNLNFERFHFVGLAKSNGVPVARVREGDDRLKLGGQSNFDGFQGGDERGIDGSF